MKKLIVLVTSDLISDQRVHKMCLSLHNSGNDVLLIGRKLNQDVLLKRSYEVKRFNMIFRKGFLFSPWPFFGTRLSPKRLWFSHVFGTKNHVRSPSTTQTHGHQSHSLKMICGTVFQHFWSHTSIVQSDLSPCNCEMLWNVLKHKSS